MSAIIQVEGLSKKFVLRHENHERYTALRDVLVNKFKNLSRFGKSNKSGNTQEEFWALKDINFTVEQGDRLAVIGRNGAGKSTMLKILSRITEPTSGRITIDGRMSSLLEVGTGFHPELTGRENIYLNGAILGMSRAEISRKFDEIVSFAEVEKFLDTPVKRYSSGMYVRLAFSVSAHLEPEILIVDEVLAVGDAQFQRKCLGKMEDVSKNDGRTVLFVSHNIAAVQSLCNKGLLLDGGQLNYMGNIQDTVIKYLNKFKDSQRRVEYNIENAPGNSDARLLFAEVRHMHKEEDNDVFYSDQELELSFSFVNNKHGLTNLDITFHLYDELGNLVFVGSTAWHNDVSKYKAGTLNATVNIPGNLLHEGLYNIRSLLLVQDRGFILMEAKDVLQFEILNQAKENFGWNGSKEGVVKPKLFWKVNQ